MKELVDKTGMSKGAFYHYFKSKEQVFLESLEFFVNALERNYSSYSQDSLKQFYNDYLNETVKLYREYSQKFEDEFSEVQFTINHFALIFDTLKLFPDFRKRIKELFNYELAHWIEIIKVARSKGEIKPSISDIKLGEMFVYLSDGIGINMIMRGAYVEDMVEHIKNQWDALYEQIKT